MNIETIKTSTDKTIVGFSNDYLFNIIKNGNEFPDDFLLPIIDKYVNSESVCIDVGANLGYVSIYLAQKCRKLYSIEPQPVVYLQLCANLFLNKCFNASALNIGCHSYRCNLDFAEYQSGWAGTDNVKDIETVKSFGALSLTQNKTGNIEAHRLDSLFSNQKIDFIKIDCQGADIDVILGAEEIIKQYHPVIVFEYEEDMSVKNYGRVLSDLYPFLEKYNYKISQLFGENHLLS